MTGRLDWVKANLMTEQNIIDWLDKTTVTSGLSLVNLKC